MQTELKKMNQVLTRDREAKKREDLMLFIVNLNTPLEGWTGKGWSKEEMKEFTVRLRAETEDYWPELWRPIENQSSTIEERAWGIIGKMRAYLRLFWSADNKRARDWHIHRAREYHERLRILPTLLKIPESRRDVEAELMLDEPPTKNPIETALYELQKRADKPKWAPRVCPNDCERKYFLSTQKGYKYCPDCRRSQAARDRESKRKSYRENKNKWPSTSNRRKARE
jgi:hypothetical protein